MLPPPVSEVTPEHHRRHIWMGMQDVAPSDAAAWKVTLTSLAVWMTKEAHCCPQY